MLALRSAVARIASEGERAVAGSGLVKRPVGSIVFTFADWFRKPRRDLVRACPHAIDAHFWLAAELEKVMRTFQDRAAATGHREPGGVMASTGASRESIFGRLEHNARMAKWRALRGTAVDGMMAASGCQSDWLASVVSRFAAAKTRKAGVAWLAVTIDVRFRVRGHLNGEVADSSYRDVVGAGPRGHVRRAAWAVNRIADLPARSGWVHAVLRGKMWPLLEKGTEPGQGRNWSPGRRRAGQSEGKTEKSCRLARHSTGPPATASRQQCNVSGIRWPAAEGVTGWQVARQASPPLLIFI
ncbi:hypothetical protein OBBRIDRAFT_879654 [Obba rivulosa]|uniref:Uncharacterized protein n=1 Tax=Obba rivulosa TaxID=1052685 RepID=A0A8E2AS23_9APHY|nr:hypothetical protein OBBRIDRAFT_879654 [Obba rivulosa]